MIFKLLFICLLAMAALRSFTEVALPPHSISGIVPENQPGRPGSLKDKARASWLAGEWLQAATHYRQIQASAEATLQQGYSDQAIHDLLICAQFFMEESAHHDALAIFAKIMEMDKQKFGNDSWQVGRDFNNLAICTYLAGKCKRTEARRLLHFNQARAHLGESQRIFSSSGNENSATVRLNALPVLRDCGMHDLYNQQRKSVASPLP